MYFLHFFHSFLSHFHAIHFLPGHFSFILPLFPNQNGVYDISAASCPCFLCLYKTHCYSIMLSPGPAADLSTPKNILLDQIHSVFMCICHTRMPAHECFLPVFLCFSLCHYLCNPFHAWTSTQRGSDRPLTPPSCCPHSRSPATAQKNLQCV